MKGKTVGELIGSDINCKLGAIGGSAFVYCGNLKDVDICDVDEAIRNRYQISLDHAKRDIKQLAAKDKTYGAYKKDMQRRFAKASKGVKDENALAELKEKYKPTKLGWHQWTADITRRLEYARTVRRKVNKRLNEYTSIAERTIVDAYKSIDEKNTVILLYNGKENGIAWTTGEYLNGTEGE